MTQEPFTEQRVYPPVDSDPSSEGSTQDVAKDQASQVGQGAADAGKHVAGVAKDQAASVAGEAKSQVRNLAGQARSEVEGQAHQQKQRVSDGLRSIGHELGSMADGSEQQGTATDLAKQASQFAHDAASWLEDRDPGALLEEVRDFARRRPGAFLGIALGAGVLAGRLTRGIKDSNGSGGSASPGSSGLSSSTGSGTTGYSAPEYSAPEYGTTSSGATYATEPYAEPSTEPYAEPYTQPYAETLNQESR